MPLQDLPCGSLQGSMLSQSNKMNKRKSTYGFLSEGLDMECTPTESIQQWSPHHKHQRLLSMGKENACNQFVLARRSRRKKESTSCISWDHLPDELLLRILFYIPLQDLLRMSTVCKRWHRLAFDESLWHSVDLEGLTHVGPALQQVLKTGVRMLRCPRSFMEEFHFTGSGPLQIVLMDLSSSMIPSSSLESILCHCRLVEYLSLEALQLSDAIISSLSMNPNLLQLNLSGCSGFSAPVLTHMLKSCTRIEQLNMSWCDFDNNHVKSVVNNVNAGVTHLNLSGYRESLTLEDVKVLVARCPDIQALDLSDSTLLMADSFPCPPTAEGSAAPLPEPLLPHPPRCTHGPGLHKELPRISINSRPFSGIARPTPATGLTGSFMWNRKCRLRFRL
ncbi:hypothetical protein PBY51_023136 [Eleginops maclovinus]|uniref:F-box domain-containing protein n=1 Tax=Eleginops maclovinus TaxID=56733 RepID=A0AAN8A8J3_ELEMC|nr:hypothetical protein PBY51_023136 [Eleginops maclovinus]